MVVNPIKYIGSDFVNCVLWTMVAMLESKLNYDSWIICVAVFMAIFMAIQIALDFQVLKDQEEIIEEANKIITEMTKEEEEDKDNDED